MPTSGDLKSADSLFTTPHPLPRNSMNLCLPPHLLKIWEWLRTLYGKPWLSYVVIYHYVVWLLHYVLWFLHYLVCSQMWCGFVFMFCWLHFRYKALAPRLYSLLATSQTGFKTGLSSCSFPFLLISVWRENITKSIPKDLKLESLISKFAAERIEPENVSELSDDELVRLGVTTIGDRHRLRALCANTEKRISLWLQLLLANAWLFSADLVAAVEGVDLVRKEKFLRRELDSIKLSFV